MKQRAHSEIKSQKTGETTKIPDSNNSTYKLCSKCRNLNDGNASFCRKCGNDINSESIYHDSMLPKLKKQKTKKILIVPIWKKLLFAGLSGLMGIGYGFLYNLYWELSSPINQVLQVLGPYIFGIIMFGISILAAFTWERYENPQTKSYGFVFFSPIIKGLLGIVIFGLIYAIFDLRSFFIMGFAAIIGSIIGVAVGILQIMVQAIVRNTRPGRKRNMITGGGILGLAVGILFVFLGGSGYFGYIGHIPWFFFIVPSGGLILGIVLGIVADAYIIPFFISGSINTINQSE